MSRGPSGSNLIWQFDAESGLDAGGIWQRLQNDETASSSVGSLIANWPNGSGTRTTVPAASGFDGVGKAVRFELRNGDVAANGERTELSGDGASWQFHEGDERWLQFRVKFASDWAPGTADRFSLITQFHSGSGSPPMSIHIWDSGAMMLDFGGPAGDANRAAGITAKTILTSAEWYAKRGQWMDINLHWKNSNSISVGFAEVHVDGVLKVPKHNRQTMASSRNYLKMGMYRHPQAQTNVLYFDDIRLTSGTETGGSDPDPGGAGFSTITGVDGATRFYETDDGSGPQTTWTIPTPTAGGALQTGDMLVAAMSYDTTSTTAPVPTIPSGWSTLVPMTVQGSLSTTVASMAIYHFVTSADAASPPTWTVSHTAAWDGTISVGRFRGVNQSDPFAITGGSNYAQATYSTGVNAKVAPSVTTDVANAMLITGGANRSGSNALAVGSPSVGYTLIADAWAITARASGLAYKAQTAAGASTTATWQQASGTAGVGQVWQTALNPAPTGGATAPVVDAGAGASVASGGTVTRTASENDGGAAITARTWKIQSGPSGVGTTLSTTAALSWTAPSTTGTYVLRYSATNSVGTGTDDATVIVNATGTGAIDIRQHRRAWTNWQEVETYTSLSLAYSSTPLAGSFLAAAWSVNGDAGTFTPPTGWTVLAERDVVGVAMLVCYKISAGNESNVAASWTLPTEQASVVVVEYTGVHQTNPLGPNNFPAFVDANANTITLDPAPAVVNGAALAFIATAGAGGTAGFDPEGPTGWFRVESSYGVDNTSSTGIAVLDKLSVTSGEDLSPTFTWTHPERRLGFIQLLNSGDGTTIPDIDPPPPDPEEPPPPIGTSPILRSRQVGFPETGLGRVAANIGSAVKARLKVGTNPAVTSGIIYGPYATPNAQGDTKMTVGLPTTTTSGTYYYRVAMVNSQGGEWLDTASTVGRLKTAPKGRAGLTFSFGSCCNASDTACATAIFNRQDDVCMIHGDLWYNDARSDAVADYRAEMDGKLRAPNIGRMIATTPFIYTPSDHDYGMVDDGTGNNTGYGARFNQVFREKISAPDLPTGSLGVYWTRPWGTAIRFIVLDTRTFNVIGSTKLGATQKAWLKSTITAATEDLLIICQDGVWIGGTDAGSDDWQGTITERNEIGDFILASGKSVVWIGGDMHAVAADNGTNSRGGFPVYMAAPLNNSSSIKGGPYSAGTYPTSAGTTVQQYGRIVVTLGATSITSQFTGYSSDNTVRKTMSNTFPARPAPPPEPEPDPVGRAVEMWDGVELISRRGEKWTGSALAPGVIEI